MLECVRAARRCARVCVCVMTFPWRAGARFINHKHEPMDPITPWRYVCLLSSVKSKERQEGRDGHMCAGLSLSVDAGAEISTSLPGRYCQRCNFSLPVYVTMNKGLGIQILSERCCLHNKWIDWQESEKPGGLV